MLPLGFFLKFIVIIQVTNVIVSTYATYDNYIAFKCGRPALIFRNDKWIADYEQNCIEDEKEIVAFCKRTFPDKNITSAEPAKEKVKFSNWCDFKNSDCDVKLEIRPFKCLEFSFQSDALTLPRDCLFAHLGGKDECKIYKDWVIDARAQCSLKPGWQMRSYGMLFQCGFTKNDVIPMFFRGVEFVCCPQNSVKTENDKVNANEQRIYKNYLSNGVLETGKEEDKTYEDSLNELKLSFSKLKKDLINDLKNGEMDLKKLWKTDPKLAKFKESALISQFKLAYRALKDQFTVNKERLLDFHDDRRKFLFTTKIYAAMKQLDLILEKKTDIKVNDLVEVMKRVLELLMTRKKEIIEERVRDTVLGSHLIGRLSLELKVIESNVTNVFNRLNQVPQFKEIIKQQLVMFLMNKFPDSSFENVNQNTEETGDNSKITEIISKYKFKPDSDDDDLNSDKSRVHYDLGLDDSDQEGHHGNTERKFIFDHDIMEKQFGDKKLLFALVFGTLITAFVILLVGSLLIMYRHRPGLFKYTKTKLHDQHPCKQTMQGFGIESSSVGKDMVSGMPFNVYENPTYKVIQTALDTVPNEVPSIHNSESLIDNQSSPLIRS